MEEGMEFVLKIKNKSTHVANNPKLMYIPKGIEISISRDRNTPVFIFSLSITINCGYTHGPVVL